MKMPRTTVNTCVRHKLSLKIDFDRQLNPCKNIGTKFLATAIKLQNKKDYIVVAIFLLFIQFSTIEVSLFSHKANDKLIKMTGKNWECLSSLVSYSHLDCRNSISRCFCHVFNMHLHEHALTK